MLMIDCDVENGGMNQQDFIVDFGKEPNGPAAATKPAIPAAIVQATSGCERDPYNHNRQPRCCDLQVRRRAPIGQLARPGRRSALWLQIRRLHHLRGQTDVWRESISAPSGP